MKKTALLLLLLAIACGASAQTTNVTGTVTDASGNAYANGTASAQKVVVSGQNPGFPISTVTNGSGTFSFAALSSPASYVFTICGTPVQLGPKANPVPTQVCFNSTAIAISGASQDIGATLSAIAPLLGPSFASFTSAANVFGPLQTFNGGLMSGGLLTAMNINGSLNPLQFAGSDIGAQINAANAAFPGQPIVIPPSSSCYQFSTPIVVNAGSVPTSVRGAGAGSTCLQYTASSGIAFSFSSALTNGIAGTISDFELMTTVSGSTATGLYVGPNNTCSNCKVQRMYIHGFQTEAISNTYAVEYGQDEISNCSNAAGSVGIQTTGAFADDTKILGGRIIGCSTLLKIGNAFVVWVDGLLLENAGSLWVDNTSAGALECNHCHWFNISTGPTTNWFSSTGPTIINNSLFEGQKTTGTPTQFATQTGSFISLNNNYFVTSGEAPTQFVTLAGTVIAEFTGNINGSPASILSLWNTGYNSGTVNAFGNHPNVNQTQDPLLLFGSGTLNSPNLLISATAPTISSGFNTSGFQLFTNGSASFTIVVGTGAATSTGVLALPTAAAGWSCWLTNQSRADLILQSGSTTASATFTNYGTTFVATNFTNSDLLRGGCMAN